MNEESKYIYGIINSNQRLNFGVCGVTDSDVYTICYKDTGIVVSDSPEIDYTYMLKDAVARLLVMHQKAIEKIMSSGYVIIPVKLGTFAEDENEVIRILDKGYNLIKEIFDKINDKIEIDVVATWSDFNSTLKEIACEKEIKEFKEKLSSNSKGITAEDQIKIGVMIKHAIDKKREKYAEEIQNTLKTVSCDFKAHELMDDRMVINIAFLIDKLIQKDFYQKIEEIDTQFDGKLNFRCVGPLPAYSFYTLEIKKLNFKEIDAARKILNLPEKVTSDEIKKAYHRLAFVHHPDMNRGDCPDGTVPEDEGFDGIKKACSILLDYCWLGDTCSFDKENFEKNPIIVKLRG